jgi:hypothetical protein
MEGADLYVFELRRRKMKSRGLALAEIMSLFGDLGASLAESYPALNKKGALWVTIPSVNCEKASRRFGLLGYTDVVYRLDQIPDGSSGTVWFRNRSWELTELHRTDSDELRESAPDRRDFELLNMDGSIKRVKGYRGGRSTEGPKPLTVPDCKLLVNLVYPGSNMCGSGDALSFLDPFAGVGGIVIEAARCGHRVYSCDIEPRIAPGLRNLDSFHSVADCALLPFSDGGFDLLATELPFSVLEKDTLSRWVFELNRVMKKQSSAVFMTSREQYGIIRHLTEETGRDIQVYGSTERKKKESVVFGWKAI